MIINHYKTIIYIIFLSFSGSLAAELPDDDLLSMNRPQPATEEPRTTRVYPSPVGPRFEAGDAALNCRQLDQAIAMLENDTYTAKPGFYEDPYTGASIWISAIWAPGALAYLGYSGVAEYYEDDRIHDAQSRIEALRRIKAQSHCYEY